MMFLIKLGGSVVTEKEVTCTFDSQQTRALVDELSGVEAPLLVTHGGGSFGHQKAARYRLNEGLLEGAEAGELDQVRGFSEVQKDMRDLNQDIIGIMNEAGMRAVSVPTASVALCRNGELNSLDHGAYDRVLDLGAVPVSFGDVVFDTEQTFTICSADAIMVGLAERYRPERAIFVTNVDGLIDGDPEDASSPLIEEVRGEEDLPALGQGREEVGRGDVTGDMAGKVRSALAMAGRGVETLLVNGTEKGRLAGALSGSPVRGTRFVPQESKDDQE